MIPPKISLKNVETPDKVQMVVSALHDYIIDNALEPGTELPSESDMATQLGVSKFSMREALRIAQAQGLIEITRGRRTRVAHISVEPVTGVMNLLLKRSEATLLELTEARKCLECYIVRLAAGRIQPEHLDAMEGTIDELKQHIDDVEYCIDKDLEFHQILVQAMGNRVFESMLAPLAELLKQSRMKTLYISGVQKAIDEHSQILNALRKKDPELAEACMRQHLATAEEIIRESVERKR
jgi:DNA-binding FadR family transcriptional regulator